GVVTGAVILLLPTVLWSQTPTASNAPTPRSTTPSIRDMTRTSPTGNYLAARHADAQRDAAAASAYFRAALRTDPRNGELLERAFLATLAEGDFDEGLRLAERIVEIDRSDRVARLVLGIRALKQKQYSVARQQFAQSTRGQVSDLTGTLLTAWAQAGANDPRGAVDTIDKLTGQDWYPLFKELHAGLIYDLAGMKKEAGKRYEHAYQLNPNSLRLVEAYGSWLSRNGSKDEALKVFTDFDTALPRHPLIQQAIKRLKGEGSP